MSQKTTQDQFLLQPCVQLRLSDEVSELIRKELPEGSNNGVGYIQMDFAAPGQPFCLFVFPTPLKDTIKGLKAAGIMARNSKSKPKSK